MLLCIKLAVLVDSKEISSDFGKHLRMKRWSGTKKSMGERTLSSKSLSRSSRELSTLMRLEALERRTPPALKKR